MALERVARQSRSTDLHLTVYSIGKPILAALTQEEIAGLLDILFTLLPPDSNQQVLEQLLPDTRQTLEQILSPPLAAAKTAETATKPISIAKQAETWSALWDQWDGIVSEAAQEDGEYITQEEHWEPVWCGNWIPSALLLKDTRF